MCVWHNSKRAISIYAIEAFPRDQLLPYATLHVGLAPRSVLPMEPSHLDTTLKLCTSMIAALRTTTFCERGVWPAFHVRCPDP